ncbi:CcdB family protein [Siccibacter colletis]|uniref:CcdB family protein n=1 Tax=Siccibacter colletis TaxID=1505757 RepID=UPI0028BD8AC8|nr:CcdB family protein [Siccibacter colletis]WNN48712.1 CcdB family protein [Siccibacter colletis]
MQFQVYRNGSGNKRYPYLIGVQSDLVDVLSTRVVIPLIPASMAEKPLPARLNPVIQIDGEDYFVMTSEMASVSKTAMGDWTCSAMPWRTQIKSGMDFLFDGF